MLFPELKRGWHAEGRCEVSLKNKPLTVSQHMTLCVGDHSDYPAVFLSSGLPLQCLYQQLTLKED